MSNKEPGYIYIQTRSTSGRLHTCNNPSFREDWVKIGKSSRPVDVRRNMESAVQSIVIQKFSVFAPV